MPEERWLLLRRSVADGELAYYVCYVPPGMDLGKGRGHGWYPHMLLQWRHPPRIMHIVGWLLWRRWHQTVARAHHYRRRREKNNLQL